MPVTFGNANYQKKFDAFRVVHQSGCEPLKKAIEVALQMRKEAELLDKAISECSDQETLSKLILAQSRALPDELFAWIKIAEFIYAKPKQQLEVSGAVTLEQVLSQSNKLVKAIDTAAE